VLPPRTKPEFDRQPESNRRDSFVFVHVYVGQCARQRGHERRRLVEGYRPVRPFQLHASRGSCTDSVRRRATIRPGLARRARREGDDARAPTVPGPRDHPRELMFAAKTAQRHREAWQARCGRAFQYERFSRAMPDRTSAAPPACVLRSTPAFPGRRRHSWLEIHARQHGRRPGRAGAIERAAQPRDPSG